jgi:hypothetical protein
VSTQCLLSWCTEDHDWLNDWDDDSGNGRPRIHRRTWPSGFSLLLLEPDDEHDGFRISLAPDDNNDVKHTGSAAASFRSSDRVAQDADPVDGDCADVTWFDGGKGAGTTGQHDVTGPEGHVPGQVDQLFGDVVGELIGVR